jgi:large subunit ribosomal protein L17
MRHRKAGNPLGRNSSHRRAMLRNMVTSLFKHEQIETTNARAKAIRPVAEKMITLAKRGDLHARRQALAYLMDKEVTHRLFDKMKDRYTERQGGYVRIVQKGQRIGDGARISIVQLISDEKEKKSGKKAKKPATSKPDAGKPPKKPKTTESKPKAVTSAEKKPGKGKTTEEKAEKEKPAEKRQKKVKADSEKVKKTTPAEKDEKRPKKAAKPKAKDATEKGSSSKGKKATQKKDE